MSLSGKLITLEGPEGAGKSTHAAALAQRLRKAGRAVLVTREPGGTRLGESVRILLKAHDQPPPAAAAELFLFLACRAQLVEEVIRPALTAGTHVICDRFTDSTIAYQGYGRGFALAELPALNALATRGLTPALTFLLDLEVETGLRRVQGREAAAGAAADRIERESLDFHRAVRAGYLELAAREPSRYRCLDARRPPEELRAEIWSIVQNVIDT